MDNILKDIDYKEAQSHITKDMLGNNHVYFLPYLMGERSPHNDPLARATFTGMTMDSTRTDMMHRGMKITKIKSNERRLKA